MFELFFQPLYRYSLTTVASIGDVLAYAWRVASGLSPMTDAGCLWTRQITVSHDDWLTDQTARQILGHSRARVERCP